MTWQDRIVIDPNILVGKPVIKGTRLSVEFIIGQLVNGWSEADILTNYPGIEREDILACLESLREDGLPFPEKSEEGTPSSSGADIPARAH